MLLPTFPEASEVKDGQAELFSYAHLQLAELVGSPTNIFHVSVASLPTNIHLQVREEVLNLVRVVFHADSVVA